MQIIKFTIDYGTTIEFKLKCFTTEIIKSMQSYKKQLLLSCVSFSLNYF